METDERLVKPCLYYWWLLAESHLTRRLFGMVRRTDYAAGARGVEHTRVGEKITAVA